MPIQLTRTEYDRLGAIKNLTLQETPPPFHNISVSWRCNLCGKLQTKSYRALRIAEHGCSCQSAVTIKINKYVLLATQLGIKWVGELQPPNTKTKTVWQSRDGRRKVSASYAQLSYMNISNQLKSQLGI